MAYFLQQLIDGLTLGAIYGLIAIGYTMVYGIVGMINFAHGDVYMIGAFVSVAAYAVCAALGMTMLPVMLIVMLAAAIAVTGLYGWVIERVAYRPLRRAPRLAPLISAIGVSIFLQNYVQLTQGARVRTMPPLLSGSVGLGVDGHAVQISWLQIAIWATAALAMGAVYLAVTRTRLGRAQRACQQDKIMAALLGIDVDRTIALTFVIGAVLAALAGFMVALYYGVVDFFMGFMAGMKAFAAAVVGGIGSLPGAMAGGIAIGLIEAMWSGYVNADTKDIAVFLTLIGFLALRPQGLFGRPEIEKI